MTLESVVYIPVPVTKQYKRPQKGDDGHHCVTLTLALEWVKVISAWTIHIGLAAHPTM